MDSGHDASGVVLDRCEFYWQRAECVLHLDGVGLGLAQHEAGETLLGSGVLVFKQDIHAFGQCVFQILIMFFQFYQGFECYARALRAKRAGDIPAYRVKCAVKWLWLENPQSCATSTRDWRLFASSSLARSSLSSNT